MTNPDLTKLQSTSLVPGFKNNDEFTGSFTIDGTFFSGSKVITKTIELPNGTDIAEVIFQGRADGGFVIPTDDPRPNNAWFKRGVVWVRVDDAGAGYTNYPQPFLISASISGNTLTLKATSIKQFVANLTITAEVVQYKIIDYSVF